MKLFDIFRKKKEVVPVKTVPDKKKIKLDKETDLMKIDRFDESKHLVETFEDLFRAIRYDDWRCDVTEFGEMDFIKDRVKMKVHFSDWTSFYIKKIEIASGYQTYHYKEDLDEDHYQFFYDKYCTHRNEVNDKRKRIAEKSMEEIRTALGKDVLRDGKIDMLLNSDDE